MMVILIIKNFSEGLILKKLLLFCSFSVETREFNFPGIPDCWDCGNTYEMCISHPLPRRIAQGFRGQQGNWVEHFLFDLWVLFLKISRNLVIRPKIKKVIALLDPEQDSISLLLNKTKILASHRCPLITKKTEHVFQT